jgi:membrane protein implicated in regulation of membrane protease activity
VLSVLAVLSALVEEIVAALVLLLLLPQLGIELPLEMTAGILVVLAVWSMLTYRPIRRVLKKQARNPKQAMVGKRCAALTELRPEGLVRIEGETWIAVCTSGTAQVGEELTVKEVSGLKLTVEKG